MRSGVPKKSAVLLAVVFSAMTVTLFQNCSQTGGSSGGSDTQQIAAILNGMQHLSVTDASAEQCPTGGKIYSVFTDDNNNFKADTNETTLSVQVVCNGSAGATGTNGTNGQDGSNALISINRVTVELNVCSSYSGVQLSTGLDSNKNSLLEASEISHSEVLCDGASGQTGANGPAGANGHNAVFSVVSATVQICPNGGSVILMALDVEDQGIYKTSLPQQQSATICNGANGMNAAPSAYQIVEAIKPCGDTVANKEVLLRLQNGQLLASVSDKANGQNTRLAFMNDGNYIDTDPSACSFSLATQGGIRSISWQGSVRASWPMP